MRTKASQHENTTKTIGSVNETTLQSVPYIAEQILNCPRKKDTANKLKRNQNSPLTVFEKSFNLITLDNDTAYTTIIKIKYTYTTTTCVLPFYSTQQYYKTGTGYLRSKRIWYESQRKIK